MSQPTHLWYTSQRQVLVVTLFPLSVIEGCDPTNHLSFNLAMVMRIELMSLPLLASEFLTTRRYHRKVIIPQSIACCTGRTRTILRTFESINQQCFGALGTLWFCIACWNRTSLLSWVSRAAYVSPLTCGLTFAKRIANCWLPSIVSASVCLQPLPRDNKQCVCITSCL